MFFIVGSQRTGTTLLSLMLDSCDEISVIDEPQSYSVARSNPNNQKNLGCKIPMWTYAHKILQNRFGNETKFLFTFRDIRAVVSSMLNLKAGEGLNWITRNAKPESEDAIFFLKNDKFKDHCQRILYTESDPLKLGTFAVFLKSYFYQEYIISKRKVFPIKYEELVKNPKTYSEKILAFLDFEWDEKILSHHKFHSEKRIGDTDSSKPIYLDSISKWKSFLTNEEEKTILNYLDYLLDLVQNNEKLLFDLRNFLVYE